MIVVANIASFLLQDHNYEEVGKTKDLCELRLISLLPKQYLAYVVEKINNSVWPAS